MNTLKNIQPKPVRWEIHVLIWVAYSLLWLFLLNSPSEITVHIFVGNIVYLLAGIALCYFNIFVLMPRFFSGKKSWLYLPIIFVALLVFSFVHAMLMYGYLHYICQCGGESFLNFKQAAPNLIGSNTSLLFIPMIIHLYRQRRALQEHQQELEKAQLTSELKYLKSQLNPHFLFNALNSIYFLIKKDPEQAADALAGFSDLLRYQLYQTNDGTINLREEMENLEKYVQLAALRKSDEMKINIDFPQDFNPVKISPLLLIPLVENAFKHTGNEAGFIDIKGKLVGDSFTFSVRNNFEKYNSSTPQIKEEGGIGLVNIKRRLELLYPKKHDLKIEEGEKEFFVELVLEL